MSLIRIVHMQGREESSFEICGRARRLLMKWDTLADSEDEEEEEEGRGKRVSESLRVQDQTEPQVEPALMWDPRTTSERRNGLCIRRNFGAAQEQACETCRMLRGRGHHGSQHANATEFFRSESRNLLA